MNLRLRADTHRYVSPYSPLLNSQRHTQPPFNFWRFFRGIIATALFVACMIFILFMTFGLGS